MILLLLLLRIGCAFYLIPYCSVALNNGLCRWNPRWHESRVVLPVERRRTTRRCCMTHCNFFLHNMDAYADTRIQSDLIGKYTFNIMGHHGSSGVKRIAILTNYISVIDIQSSMMESNHATPWIMVILKTDILTVWRGFWFRDSDIHIVWNKLIICISLGLAYIYFSNVSLLKTFDHL